MQNQQSKTDNLPLAIASIIAATLTLSLGDAIIKLISVQFSLWQLYAVRSALVLTMMLAVMQVSMKKPVLLPESFFWTITRGLLLSTMWIAYYVSLPHIPISVAAAVFYTIPLFITLFSAMFSGDRVTGMSWLAIVIGFTGVLVIVRPDSSGFNSYVLLPLLAAICYAVAMILTRVKCMQEQPQVLALWLHICMAVIGCAGLVTLWLLALPDTITSSNQFLLESWVALSGQSWLALLVLAVAILIGSVGTAIAYQNGPSPIVASFDYFYLAFSILWGVLIFTELPDLVTLAGILLVAVGGIIAVRYGG